MINKKYNAQMSSTAPVPADIVITDIDNYDEEYTCKGLYYGTGRIEIGKEQLLLDPDNFNSDDPRRLWAINLGEWSRFRIRSIVLSSKAIKKTTKLLLAMCLLLASTSIHAKDLEIRVTNYRATKQQCGNSKGITASGHRVQVGICAGDWRHYPPGTIIKLDNKELIVVADKGSKVKGKHHIDRYNPTNKRYPTISRGVVIKRGDSKWRSKRRGAFLAVKAALVHRKHLIAEQNQQVKTYRAWCGKETKITRLILPTQCGILFMLDRQPVLNTLKMEAFNWKHQNW